jgi:hypothetical protein
MKRACLIGLLVLAIAGMVSAESYLVYWGTRSGEIKEETPTTAYSITSADQSDTTVWVVNRSGKRCAVILTLDSNNLFKNDTAYAANRISYDRVLNWATLRIYVTTRPASQPYLYFRYLTRRFLATTGGTWSACSTGIAFTGAGACADGGDCDKDTNYTVLNRGNGTGYDRWETAQTFPEEWQPTITAIDIPLDTGLISRIRWDLKYQVAILIELDPAGETDSCQIKLYSYDVETGMTPHSYLTVDATKPMAAGTSPARRRRAIMGEIPKALIHREEYCRLEIER